MAWEEATRTDELMAIHAFTVGFGEAIHWKGKYRPVGTGQESYKHLHAFLRGHFTVIQSSEETAGSSEGVIRDI